MLWNDETTREVISFELKTNKRGDGALNKEEVGQSHDSMQWVKDNFAESNHLGHLFPTEISRVTSAANPHPEWHVTTIEALSNLIEAYVAEVERIRALTGEQRRNAIATLAQRQEWSTKGILGRLALQRLKGG